MLLQPKDADNFWATELGKISEGLIIGLGVIFIAWLAKQAWNRRKSRSSPIYLIPEPEEHPTKGTPLSRLEQIYPDIREGGLNFNPKAFGEKLQREKEKKISPFTELEFEIYPPQDELTKRFSPNLLRYGILTRNGSTEQEVYTYWMENENGERLHRFPANRNILPKRLEPNERYIFEYLYQIGITPAQTTEQVRPCIQLDGPSGKIIRGELTSMPEPPDGRQMYSAV